MPDNRYANRISKFEFRICFKEAPHSSQNLAVSRLSCPQAVQVRVIVSSLIHSAAITLITQLCSRLPGGGTLPR